MLLKYSGISFISGAVNHGFFSSERSLWTAAIGMLLFVLGAWMEHRLSVIDQSTPSAGLMQSLAQGAVLSIGLGFFTGGLQHFPDSPARSAWVVPLGFFISVVALAWNKAHPWQRGTTAYVVMVGLLVLGSSFGAWQWLAKHPEWAATGHAHGTAAQHNDTHSGTTSPQGPSAMLITRSIDVRMDDQMRFTPALVEVHEGETIRFVVHNAGLTAHEMVLGSDADIQAHAKAMQQGAGHGDSHGSGAAISVGAGQTGEMVVKFDQAQTLQMACLVPGHYEAGMSGRLNVFKKGDITTPAVPASHDHSSHKH
jgi:uncharacterized cupredoxin-like copper-binding protein